MKFLKVLLAATLIIPCSLIAQVPIATFEVDELKIPSLVLGDQNYKDIVMKYLGGIGFDVTQIQETTDPIIHSSSKFESGKLVVNALELGNETYADLLFDYVGGTSLNLSSLKGPVKELSFKQTDFLLVEPKEWKTTERVYNNNLGDFENKRSQLLVNDFPLIDVDQDGRKDLIIAGTQWDGEIPGTVDEAVPLRWMRNTGNGFEPGDSSVFPISSARYSYFNMHVADFNNDGIDDFFGPDTGDDKKPFSGGENLLLLSNSDGTYTDSSENDPIFDYLGFTHGSGIGDINNDGNIDIVTNDVCAYQIISGMRVLINDGTGNFKLAELENTDEYDSSSTSQTFCPGWQVSLADLNNDGYDEIIMGSNALNIKEDRIFWNDQTGKFDLSKYTSLPKFKTFDGYELNDTLATLETDLNYDGLVDIVMSKSERYLGKGLQFLINNGDKSFSDETDFYSPWSRIATNVTTYGGGIPYQIKEIDINNDGLLDIKLNYEKERNWEDGIWKIYSHFWIKQRDGSYEELSTDILNQEGWFWLIDYDEDGDIDIINRSSRSQQREGEESYLSDEIFEWRILENESL
jgi:hypothetical protein